MHKVLQIIPALAYNGAAKQLLLLATGLPRHRFEVRVAVLGETACYAETLRAAGILVHELAWKRLFDPGPFRRLRQLVEAFRPDMIHTWCLSSLRFLATAGALRAGRLIASAAIPSHKSRSFWHQLDCVLLRAPDFIIAAGFAEAERYRKQKISPGRIVEVPPGVAPLAGVEERGALCRLLGIDKHARWILCAGPLFREKGVQDAIWTFEILKFLYDDLHLLVIGAGPDRCRLEQFASTIRARRYVHFLGKQPDVASFFAHCDVVWVPSRRRGGLNVALEAMAAGRPVVASRLPALAEIIKDAETGFLVDPGDKVALARKTRLLLDDPKQRQQMGQAGQQRIEDNFTAAQLVERVARLYEEVMLSRGVGEASA